MRKPEIRIAAIALCVAALAGCGGDAHSMLTTNAPMREQILSAIIGDRDLSGRMLDRFLSTDSTQTLLLDRLMGDVDASRQLMLRVASDRSKLDGIIQLAVQDTATRSHVVSLLQGIQMASSPAATTPTATTPASTP
jgi:hypothetical protein